MRTAITIDRRFLDHDPGHGHPERPDRIAVLLDLIHDWRGVPLEQVPPREALQAELTAVHSAELFATIAATAGRTRTRLDADTVTSPSSFEVARLAAGGVIDLVDAVADRSVENGFAFVRPPGHHATRGQAMGFCLFNNVAVAAAHLKKKHGLTRIAIVDWDLHHGNGTQAAFYDDPSVLYVSLHQYPYYPGTGAATEVGSGAGAGFTVNVPFSAGVGDHGYRAAFGEIIAPILAQYVPEFVLISAGFDCHHRDPLGGMEVTESGFADMARILIELAREVSGGRIAAVLEGGYDLDAIRNSAEAVLERLTHVGGRSPEAASSPSGETGVFDRLKEILRPYWTL